jgi:hypothetical protein
MTRANDAGDRARRAAPAAAAGPPVAAVAGPVLHLPPPVPVAAVAPARTRRGRLSSKFGTVNYSVDEMRRLNAKVRAVLPVSADEWLHVAYQFNYLRPDSIPYREVESLKRKFKKMYCARSSGGGGGGGEAGGAFAGLPDYLVEAKALRQLINQRSDKAQSEDAQSDLGGAPEDPVGANQRGADEDEDAGQQQDAGQQDDAAVPGVEGRPTTMLLADALRDDGAGGEAAVETETQELRHLRASGQQQPIELPEDGLADGAGGLASRLRQIDEDYQRSVMAAAGGRQTVREGGELQVVATAPTTSSTTELHSPTAASAAATHQALVPPGGPLSTTGIISMLKHSIERKRRTAEEQLLHESARVRKERKKRKMEQVLHSIHQEQRERESSGAQIATGVAAAGSEARLPPSPSQHAGGLSHSLFQPSAPSSVLPSASTADASSVGLMEIMLQYMTAQQLETARRHELEEERRRHEQLAREERRRLKDRQRRRQHQELMLALRALLGDKFPPSLRHLVDGAPSESTSEQEEAEPPTSSLAVTATTSSENATTEGDKERDAVEDGTSVLL